MKVFLNKTPRNIHVHPQYYHLGNMVSKKNYEINVAQKANKQYIACLTKPYSTVEIREKNEIKDAVGFGKNIEAAIKSLLKKINNKTLIVSEYLESGKIKKYNDII